MKTRAERFLKSRLNANLTQTEAAERVGVLQQSVNKIEAGIIESPRDPDKYAKLYKVSVEWLMFGKGEIPLWAMKELNQIPENFVPVLEWSEIEEWIKNGAKNLDMNENTRVFIQHPDIEHTHRKNIFAVKIKNDTMGSTHPGQISFTVGGYLLAEPMPKCSSGHYVIVKKIDEEEPFFRQIVKDGDRLFIKPINPQYKTVRLDKNYLVLAVAIARSDFLVQ